MTPSGRNERELREAYAALEPPSRHPDDEAWEKLACEELKAFERAAAFDHIVACRRCAEIWPGLRELREGARAFDSGVPAPVAGHRPGGLPAPGLYALAAMLAIALAGAAVFRMRIEAPAPRPAAAPSAAVRVTSPSLPAALPIEKAPVLIAPADALLFRGAGDPGRRAFLEELARALEPYRADDFAEAAARLRTLAGRHPGAPEPAFYLGVSELMLDRRAEAVAALQPVTASSSPTFAPEAQLYLAVARIRGGEAEAASALSGLCGGDSTAKDRACRALRALETR